MLVAISLPPLTDDTKRHRPIEPIPAGRSRRSKAALMREDRVSGRVGERADRLTTELDGERRERDGDLHRPARRTAAANPAPSCGEPRRVLPAGRTPLGPSSTSLNHGADGLDHVQSTREHEARQQDVGRPHNARQRALGTKICWHRPASRTERRYPDQNVIGSAHDGQSGRGNSTSRPAAA